MYLRRPYICAFILISALTMLSGQTYPLYSQYILNEFIINPAVAGVDGMTSISISGKKQWAGFKRAPNTYSASVSTRILKSPGSPRPSRGMRKLGSKSSGRVGLGGGFIADFNGRVNRTTLQMAYTYHLPIRYSQLSMGIAMLGQQLKIDGSDIELDPGDPVKDYLENPGFLFDAAAGINYSTHKYHVGFSVYNLFESTINSTITSKNNFNYIREQRIYNLIGAYQYKHRRNSDWVFEPSMLVRTIEPFSLSNVTTDVSVRAIYNREYWGGLSYRTTGDIIVLLGLKINKLYLGYSIDYGFNDLSRTSYGSHEVVMALKLGDSTRRYRWWERY
ncbi:MAG: PorP/SprF family type IX secretion system membrane protein [Bacteroidales bacterium]|nr:PorP/SprF family type IX secretion system membrane protein [Bacteroidales bacterium]